MTDAIDRTVRDPLYDEADLTERVPSDLDVLTIPIPRQAPPPTTGPWPVVRARGTRTVRAVAAPPPIPPRRTSPPLPPPLPPRRASTLPSRRAAALPPPLPPRRAASGTAALPIVRAAPPAITPPAITPPAITPPAITPPAITPPGAGDTSAFAAWLVRDTALVGRIEPAIGMFDAAESVPVRRARRTPRWYYVVAIEALVAVGILTAVIVLVVRGDGEPAPRVTFATPAPIAAPIETPAAAPEAPIAAAPPVAPAPAPIVDAAPARVPPPPPAKRTHRTRRRVATTSPLAPTTHTASARTAPRAGQGTLVVSTTPPCEIAIDGKRTRLRTPQRAIALAAGTHRITLTNTVTRVARTIAVTVAPGKTTKLVRDFSR